MQIVQSGSYCNYSSIKNKKWINQIWTWITSNNNGILAIEFHPAVKLLMMNWSWSYNEPTDEICAEKCVLQQEHFLTWISQLMSSCRFNITHVILINYTQGCLISVVTLLHLLLVNAAVLLLSGDQMVVSILTTMAFPNLYNCSKQSNVDSLI